MPGKYLLDSTVIIDHFNGIVPATSFLMDNIEECVASVVTLAELLSRPSPGDQSQELALMSHLSVLPIEVADALLAAEFRRDQKLKLPDAFQAALSKRHGLRLVTRNTKDFNPATFSFVDVPYTL
jgi:predicted nucleic acid-binding protein